MKTRDNGVRAIAPSLVVINRPRERALATCEALVAAGIEPLVLPTLEIEGLDPAPQIDLSDVAVVVFVSRAAAQFGAPHLRGVSRDTSIVAIGAATAGVLSELGIDSQTPARGARSEDVLNLPIVRALKPGDTVLIVRGPPGREHLSESLESSDIVVRQVTVYERIPKAFDSRLIEAVKNAGRTPWLLVTSAQALDAFRLGLSIPMWRWLNETARPLAYSDRLAAIATQIGFVHDAVIVEPGDNTALAGCIANAVHNRDS